MIGLGLSIALNPDGLGANIICEYIGKTGRMGGSAGLTYFWKACADRQLVFEKRISAGGGLHLFKEGMEGFYYNKFFSGKTSQSTGNIIAAYRDFSFTFENDYLGDEGDRFRTHTSIIKYKNFGMGLNMFTGDPSHKKYRRKINEAEGKFGTYFSGKDGDDPDQYRFSILYAFYSNLRLGVKSKRVRHLFQNKIIHDNTGTPQFDVLDEKVYLYGGIRSFNPYTAW